MNLVDTNIFLEVLLQQEKNEQCKSFLSENIGAINISDFTLHSIGVILFRQNATEVFSQFISDALPKLNLLSLPKDRYGSIAKAKKKYNLDFDDAYQYIICKHYDLNFITMDRDFRNIKDIEVLFL